MAGRRDSSSTTHRRSADSASGHSVDDVASITLVGSSADGYFIESVLARSDLAPRVRNVVFLDALYVAPTHITRWLATAPEGITRRLVSLDGGGAWTTTATRALLAALPPRLRADAAVNPSVPLPEAIRAHHVVVAHSALEHITMGILNLTKILTGLDLPPRAPCAVEGDPKDTWPGVRVASRPITRGQAVRDAMRADDARLRDGSAADDWAVTLAAGETLTATARGEREPLAGNGSLDMVLRVLRDDGEVLAENDDVPGGGVRARVRYTATRAGHYVLRVTTHGPWLRAGAYTLTLE